MKKKHWILFGLLLGALIIGIGAGDLVLMSSHGRAVSSRSSTTKPAAEVQPNNAAGYFLYDIWSSSPSDAFAVGSNEGGNGIILHYDGNAWKLMNIPTTANLYGIWGGSDSDVFVVGGNGAVLHYDGDAWTAMAVPLSNPLGPLPALLSVWGSSDSDLFAVGGSGTILHYDGSSWSVMSTGASDDFRAFLRIWGSSPSDVFAVGGDADGNAGVILHYDGIKWSTMANADYPLTGIWGSSSSDVFAVGKNGSILHYDGNSWDVENSPTKIQMSGIWGNSPSDVYAVGGNAEDNAGIIVHYNGHDWSTMMTTGYSLSAVWGSPVCGLWATGYGGPVLYHDNSQWEPLPGN